MQSVAIKYYMIALISQMVFRFCWCVQSICSSSVDLQHDCRVLSHSSTRYGKLCEVKLSTNRYHVRSFETKGTSFGLGAHYHVFVELILFFPNKFKYVPVQTGNQDQFRPQYCNFENRIFSSNLNKKKRISFQWTWFFSFVHMIYCSIDFSQKMQANERTKFLLFVSNDKFSFFYCLLIPKVPVNLLWINKHFFFSKSSMLILI